MALRIQPAKGELSDASSAATGATFLALSAWVLATRRDDSFMGGFVFAAMVIALLAGLPAVFFELPAEGLAVGAMVALPPAGLMLFRTSRSVRRISHAAMNRSIGSFS